MAVIPIIKVAIKSGKTLKELLKLIKEAKKKKIRQAINKKSKANVKKALGYDKNKKTLKYDHNAAASGTLGIGVPSKSRSIRNIDHRTENKVGRHDGPGSPITSARSWREDMERTFGGLDMKFLKKSTGGEITRGNGIAIKGTKKFKGVK